MKNIISASILLAALASAPAFSQSGPFSPSGPSPSGPLGTNVDNISTITVTNNITTVVISLDASGGLSVSSVETTTAGSDAGSGEGGGPITSRSAGGATTLTAAALIARIEAAITQVTASAGSGGGPAILLLNGLLAQLKGTA